MLYRSQPPQDKMLPSLRISGPDDLQDVCFERLTICIFSLRSSATRLCRGLAVCRRRAPSNPVLAALTQVHCAHSIVSVSESLCEHKDSCEAALRVVSATPLRLWLS